MKAIKITPALLTLLLITACVTINIYFPSAKAQQAAEKIVDDILSSGKGGTGQPPKTPPVKSPGKDKDGSASLLHDLYRIAGQGFDFLIPAAEAATPDFNIDTPEIRRLRASMKRRFGSLSGYYRSGAIGFTNNALVAIRDASAVPLKERARLKKLVAAENADRNRLYKAIANANGHPEWEEDVREVFARTWIDRAGSGWWYQKAGGSWTKK